MATWTTGFTTYLQPGVSVTLAFTWPVGKDPGVQTLLARPKGPQSWTPPPTVWNIGYEVSTESVRVAAQLKAVPNWGGSGWGGGYGVPSLSPPYQAEWTYLATVRNSGQRATWCELIGGEVR